MRRVGMIDIAKLSEVSIGTVGRALNGYGRIGEDTRKRVLQIAQQLGYEPNFAARVLAGTKAYRIGVYMPRETDFFYDQIRRGILAETPYCERLGLELRYGVVDRLEEDESEKSRELLSYDIKTLILIPRDPKGLGNLIDRAKLHGIQVIGIAADTLNSNRSSIIRVDPREVGRIAGELMGRLLPAKSRVAIIRGMLQTDDQCKKAQGFSELLPQTCQGAEVATVLECHEDEEETFAKCMALLRRFRKLAGLYVSMRNCLPVCRALNRAGLGEGIKLITTDIFPEMVPYFENGTIAASICQRPYAQGQAALRLVIDHLVTGRPIPAVLNLNPGIVFRSNLSAFPEIHQTGGSRLPDFA
jgi:LacI family transcriptional regulator